MRGLVAVEFSKEGELTVAMFRAPVERGREEELDEGHSRRTEAVGCQADCGPVSLRPQG